MELVWKNAFTKRVFAIAGLIFVFDQLTKLLVVQSIEFYERIVLIPGFLQLIHTKNKGAAFGIFHNATPEFRLVLFGIITIACLYLLFYWLATTPLSDRFHRVCLSLILGGAFGNLLDRTLFGEVTDFIDVYYGTWHWPAFNVADSAITVGVTLVVLRVSIAWIKARFYSEKSE